MKQRDHSLNWNGIIDGKNSIFLSSPLFFILHPSSFILLNWFADEVSVDPSPSGESEMVPSKITPFLWFESGAEEAAALYVSLLPNSQINRSVAGSTGAPMLVEFQLAGISFVAFNGGPHFKLTEAFSLSVACETQAEIDHLWEALSEGGAKLDCGWVRDRFGLCWQIVPASLGKWTSDTAKGQRVMQTLLTMHKLDIAQLQAAYDSD
jgi:predicted 3-demethylubiquinone-9 3-methyltransferase (glyoxalase superfamily)